MATIDEKVLLDVQVNAQDALEAYGKLQKRISELRTEQEALKKNGQENTAQFRTNEQAIKALAKRSQEYTKEIQNNIKKQHEQKGSMQQMKAELSLATAAFNKLDQAARLKDLEAGRKGLDSYSLRIKNLTGELNKAEQELLNFRRNVGNYPSAFNALGASLQGLGAKVGSSLTTMLGPFALVMGLISSATAAAKNGLATITEFSSATSNLAAILGTTKEVIEDLTEDAKRLGATTQYTATQITGLQTELAKLGFTKQEILDATGAVQNFATATGSDLAEAASLCGAALRAFGLQAKDMDRVASVLAVSTTKSALSFEYLNNGLSTIAPVAKSFGFSIEDTIALLGQLANAGFDASSAATATRNIFLNLADSNGKLAQTLGAPIKSLDDLAPAMKKLVDQGIDLATALELTDKRSVAAFSTLLQGSASVTELRDSITDCNEALDTMSAEKLDNLEGDTTLLSSAWDGLMLAFGGTESFLRPVVQWLTRLVDGIHQAWDATRDYFTGLYEESKGFRALMAVFTTSFAMAGNTIELIWNNLLTDLKAGAKIVQGIFTLDWNLIKEGWKERAESATRDFSQFLKDQKGVVQDAYEEVFEYKPNAKATRTSATGTETATQGTETTGAGVTIVDAKKAAKEAEKARKQAEKEQKEAERAAAKALREWEQLVKGIDSLLEKSDTERVQAVTDKYDRAIEKAREALQALQAKDSPTEEEKQKMYDLAEYEQRLEVAKQEAIVKVQRENVQRRIKIEEQAIKNEGAVALAEYTRTEREKNNILIEQSAKRLAVYQKELEQTSDPLLQGELQAKIAQEQDQIRQRNIQNIKLQEAEELADATLTANEKYRIKREYLEKELEAVRGNADEEKRINREMVEARSQHLNEIGQAVGKWGGQVTQIFSTISSLMKSQGEKDLADYKKHQEDKKTALKKRLDNGLMTEEDYNAQVQAIEAETAEKQAELNIKNAKWQKAMAVMNATLAAAQAIIQSLAMSPVAYGPFPNPAGIASLALATTTGLMQVAAAAATPLPTAGNGMYIEGADHAHGGVIINAEGGEAIINKRATAKFLPLLSRINQYGGGVPLYGNGGLAGTLQATQSAVEAGIDYEALARACAKIPVQVAVTDINEGQGRVARVMERKTY